MMDVDIFTHKMTGRWVAQSTNYSLMDNYTLFNTFRNQVTWTYIKNHEKYMNFLLPKLQIEYIIDRIDLYSITFKDNNYSQRKYYVGLLKQKSNQFHLLKFNDKFDVINKFIIQDYSRNYLSLISYINNITVLQKIYFLNNNVKVIKSIAKKYNQYMGTYFSSEIRIS